MHSTIFEVLDGIAWAVADDIIDQAHSEAQCLYNADVNDLLVGCQVRVANELAAVGVTGWFYEVVEHESDGTYHHTVWGSGPAMGPAALVDALVALVLPAAPYCDDNEPF